MTVNVNNIQKNILEESTLASLIMQLNIASKGIAIAVNNEIVTKDKWQDTLVKELDQITIIQATQGG